MRLSKIKLSALLIVLGLGFICVAAFLLDAVAGYLAVGIACLVLSYLNEDE